MTKKALSQVLTYLASDIRDTSSRVFKDDLRKMTSSLWEKKKYCMFYSSTDYQADCTINNYSMHSLQVFPSRQFGRTGHTEYISHFLTGLDGKQLGSKIPKGLFSPLINLVHQRLVRQPPLFSPCSKLL